MSEQPAGRIRGIHTIGVPVTDQDRALDFYVGTLGFEKRMEMPLPQLGSRWI
ncbi:VOC family protein, partial [Pseudonocardia sp.]|uniref:VOC family protein n=1 Tax=Pseudonocardia sp. TaxID=60912 RepID=UPI0031FD610C